MQGFPDKIRVCKEGGNLSKEKKNKIIKEMKEKEKNLELIPLLQLNYHLNPNMSTNY